MSEKIALQLSTDLTNFTIVHNEFIDSTLLNCTEKMVFLAIKRHLNAKTKTSFPSINLLCKHCSLSRPTVIKTIQSLEEKNILVKTKRTTKNNGSISNLYILNDTKSIWKAENHEELFEELRRLQYEQAKKIVDEYEKERELIPDTDQSADISPQINPKNNITTNYNNNQTESQERYSMAFLKHKYGYEAIKAHNGPNDTDAIFNILYDALNTTTETIRVCKVDKPKDTVISKFLKLDFYDIMHVIDTYNQQDTPIKNPEAYILTQLYKAHEQHHLNIMNQGHVNGDF